MEQGSIIILYSYILVLSVWLHIKFNISLFLIWFLFLRIKILVEIWKKYKHRLPSKLYQERMLQIADFLFGIKVIRSSLATANILFPQV